MPKKTQKKPRRIALPHDCSCTYPTVWPPDWETGGRALLDKDWEIQYRFHDPVYKADYPYGFRKRLGGMNKFKTLAERRERAIVIRDTELDLLKEGYNPIAESIKLPTPEPEEETHGIPGSTPFIQALRKALEEKAPRPATYGDFKSNLNFIEKAAIKLKYHTIEIRDIEISHIYTLLNYMPKMKGAFSAYGWNQYRANMSSLFKELIRYGAIKSNPCREIPLQKITKKKRKAPTPEDIEKINSLRETDYDLWRFIVIFCNSGSRIIELCRVQGKHVNLARQEYEVLFKKGNQISEVTHVIKNDVLPLWIELMMTCKPNDYIFSTKHNDRRNTRSELKPGPKQLSEAYLTRIYRRKCKGYLDKKTGEFTGLGVTCNLYTFKHFNTDFTAKVLSLKEAAKMNQATVGTTKGTYAYDEEARELDRLKSVPNPLEIKKK